MQSRLVSELALRGIKTIEEANAFLPEFMRDYNRRFALEPDMEASLFAPQPPGAGDRLLPLGGVSAKDGQRLLLSLSR